MKRDKNQPLRDVHTSRPPTFFLGTTLKLKKISLCKHNFKQFISKISIYKKYLVKYADDWHVGQFRHIGNSHEEDARDWCFYIGILSVPCSVDKINLNICFREVYEIQDPDLIAAQALGVLAEYEQDRDNDLGPWVQNYDDTEYSP